MGKHAGLAKCITSTAQSYIDMHAYNQCMLPNCCKGNVRLVFGCQILLGRKPQTTMIPTSYIPYCIRQQFYRQKAELQRSMTDVCTSYVATASFSAAIDLESLIISYITRVLDLYYQSLDQSRVLMCINQHQLQLYKLQLKMLYSYSPHTHIHSYTNSS